MASSAPFVTSNSAEVFGNMVRRVGAGASVLGKPFAETRGAQAVKIMRTGPKGVYRQFVDQTEYKLNQSLPWKRTQPFGTRKAGKTMLGRGLYRGAWLGAAGATQRVTPASVEIGVSASLFPQVKIHQSRRAVTKIKPTRKMRFFLGMTYGVWLKKETMKRGLKINRRRISVSSEVRRAVVNMLRKDTGSKLRGLRLTTRSL